MKELGAEKVYIDVASGKNTDRPQLKAMMEFVREGDTLIVESISRFARNTRDLLALVDQLTEKKVVFVSKKEAIDTNTPTGRFMLTVFGAVAELERDYNLQRQREGIAEAKKAGKYRGRKPIEVDLKKFKDAYSRWKAGEITATKARKQLGLSSNTFYRRVKRFEEEGAV
jgi:DNA invertase Pin-like site-specific DNA recombinase